MITGEPYNVWVQREIITPADLQETVPDMPLPEGAALACGHSDKTLFGRRIVFSGTQLANAFAPATGFISTASDLAKFYGRLAPSIGRSFLEITSRREMVRPQWPDPYSIIKRDYGLGVITGSLDAWDWFGHTGGFLGYITRTVAVPAQDLSVAGPTNAIDGPSYGWLDG